MKFHALVIAVSCGLLLSLTACDKSDGGAATWCDADGGSKNCYGSDAVTDYCNVKVARDAVSAGRMPISALPTWADKRRRNGAPIIIDFSRVTRSTLTARVDPLRESVWKFEKPNDWLESQKKCEKGLTAKDIVRTDGRRKAPWS